MMTENPLAVMFLVLLVGFGLGVTASYMERKGKVGK
jgi:hypothetical protein